MTYTVTMKGAFIADDLYAVTGPPNGKVYMKDQKPVNGQLVFTVDLLPNAYTFVVSNATLNVAIGELNVSLPP